MAPIPSLTLNDGVDIPQLGFGVFQVPPDETADTVATALETGYRHIDTAAAYENERGVGEAIRVSGIPRDEIFVTTKLWNGDHGFDSTLAAFEASQERLGLDVVDLYLIHWPVPSEDEYVDTWKAFERLKEEGRVRSIGVSNFLPEHLDRLAAETGTVPSVNQVEVHPHLQQPELRAYHAEHGIATEAWSPLAQGGEVLEEDAIGSIAQAYGVTPAQVVLRWHIELGNIIFPKSSTPERIRENIDLFGFDLSEADVEAIAALDRGERIGPDPATMAVT